MTKSLEQKINLCVDIWIEKKSIPANKRKAKFAEINDKLKTGVYTEKDLDIFIDGWKNGKYDKSKEKK